MSTKSTSKKTSPRSKAAQSAARVEASPERKSPEPLSHQAIAALAERLWENEGRPEGKADEHWKRAEAQLRKAHSSLPVENDALVSREDNSASSGEDLS
jgi:hypothetical protein